MKRFRIFFIFFYFYNFCPSLSVRVCNNVPKLLCKRSAHSRRGNRNIIFSTACLKCVILPYIFPLQKNLTLIKSTASRFHFILFFTTSGSPCHKNASDWGRKKPKQLVEVSYLKTGKAQSSWDDPSRSFASHGYNTKTWKLVK